MRASMKEPIRNRIVIHMGPSPGAIAPKRPSGRWLKILTLFGMVVVMVVVLAAAGGYFWWRHYQTTPGYSLALIVDAAQRNDTAAFDKQLDDDEIARNMVAIFKQKAESRYGVALTDSMQKQLDSLLPSLLPHLKENVHNQLAKEIKEFVANSEPRPFIIIALTVPSFVKIAAEADIAKITANIKDRPVGLTMRRDGERWKVTSLDDDTLTQHVVDELMKELPAIGQLDPSDALKKLGRRGSSRKR